MSSRERESLKKVADDLAEELIGVILGVWYTGTTAKSKKEPKKLVLGIICTEEAKLKVLQKYGDSYQGHKLYFRISKKGPVFAKH